MREAFSPYYSSDEFIELYGRVPKFREDTLQYCWDIFNLQKFDTIVEMGTSRSFVDGKHIGCNIPNDYYWKIDEPQIWDWSAGIFTRVIGEQIENSNVSLTTIDLNPTSILISKKMTEDLKSDIDHVVCSSEDFLKDCGKGTIDWLYMDTGDMTPIEETAQLQLREAKIIVENDIISDGGIILIDDVRNPIAKRQDTSGSDYGKAKYSIPYLLEHGFQIKMDEYQVVLRKQ